MGAGRAIAGPDRWGLGGETATLPSPRPPPALGHRGPGASSRLASSPAGISQQDAGWLLGQPRVAKPLQRPRPPKGQPWASKGTGGQGWMVRVGGEAKLPPPLALGCHSPRWLARPSHLGGRPKALHLPPHEQASGLPHHFQGGSVLPPPHPSPPPAPPAGGTMPSASSVSGVSGTSTAYSFPWAFSAGGRLPPLLSGSLA